MKWNIVQADHIGGRQEQQDRSLILSASNGERHWLVLADGMGGHNGGALAAQAIIDTAKQLWQDNEECRAILNPQVFLSDFCALAHQAIINLGKAQNISPHSTCVSAFIEDRQVYLIHVGDSRLYHLHASQTQFRTRDHSLVQMLVDMGRLKESEMGQHPEQNYLLRGLGGETEPELDFHQLQVQAQDHIYLCSDGYWEHVSPEHTAVQLQVNNLEINARQLVAEAVKSGGKQGDNVSLIAAVCY
ncbi:protein phosphatase 2C domain-containing protein [Candidatus Venteria ishoeyi]|uniref:PP2C family protein-serine/threonine phosphatase n=1 Tax=Candidatus Venteria ishoeyi TaxID=1899563 RepID=UPI0025A56C8B|nr:protein phosphatase 2C domain-containing protein [Candidatus Venteria ishoeyi]MDM8545863.1 protein phosphatase 2C domain-containing protein [Candidatus Venteria ishoeyi]